MVTTPTQALNASQRSAELRRELGQILRLAGPMMAVQGGVMLMGIVDTLIVGRVSSLEMAATSLGNSLVNVVLVLLIGVAMGIEPLVSQAIGAGAPERARAWLWQGVYATTLAAAPLAVLVALSPRAFGLLGIPPALGDRAAAFLWARAPGMLFSSFAAFRAYFACIGRPRPVLIAVLLGNVINGALDVVLVFGLFSAPRLGATGVGLATSIAGAFLAVFLGWLCRDGPLPRAAAAPVRTVLRLGIPVGLQLTAEVGIFTLTSGLIARLGATQLAGHQVALTLASAAYMGAVGIANATTARVGFHVGAADLSRARHAGLLGMAAGGVFMGACAASYLLLRSELAALFAPTDPGAQAVGVSLLLIAAAFAVSDGIQAVSAGALRGLGDTSWPFYANVVAYYGVALPLALVLGQRLGWGAVGYWWALTVGLTGVAILLPWRFILRLRAGVQAVSG